MSVAVFCGGCDKKKFFREEIERNADLHNHEKIAEAVVRYLEKNNGIFPESMKVLVDDGLLPGRSQIYASPYDYGSGAHEVNVGESSYVIVNSFDGEKPFFFVRRRDYSEKSVGQEGYFEANAIIERCLKKYPEAAREFRGKNSFSFDFSEK